MAWLALFLVLIQFAVVVLRHVFSIGFVPMQETVWYLHGLLFMLGAGYTLLQDAHVRVDVVYRGAGSRYKASVDLAGCILFVIPVCLLIFYVSWEYVLNSIYSFHSGNWILEGSPEFSGLPLIWAYKLVILAFALIVLLQSFSVMAMAIRFLIGAAPDYPGTPQTAKRARSR